MSEQKRGIIFLIIVIVCGIIATIVPCIITINLDMPFQEEEKIFWFSGMVYISLMGIIYLILNPRR